MGHKQLKYNIIFIIVIVVITLSGCLDANTVELKYYLGGTTVYETNATDSHMQIHNNPNAHDPTYQELINFVLNDNTDTIQYNTKSFVCIDYAVQVHDNAEKQNITAGVVSIDFFMGPGHACNVFNTTDRGYIYIDCVNSGTSHNNDKIVRDLSKGSLYHVSPITDIGPYYYVQDIDKITDFHIYW